MPADGSAKRRQVYVSLPPAIHDRLVQYAADTGLSGAAGAARVLVELGLHGESDRDRAQTKALYRAALLQLTGEVASALATVFQRHGLNE